MSDQTAVELIRNTKDADKASEQLVKYAVETLETTDNVSVIVVRLKP
jgi:serine/threonine protein phosphatase PrpC